MSALRGIESARCWLLNCFFKRCISFL